MLESNQDAYGHLIWDYFKKGSGPEIVERDDGLLDPSDQLPAYYFAQHDKWTEYEQRAMRFVKGRVLDVGCGAGRVALYLQKKGLKVLGIDISPLALRVCRLRGLRNCRLLPATQVDRLTDKFDTVLMFGNNFGLFGGCKQGRAMLRKMDGITTKNARIVAASLDPYKTNDRAHLAYQRMNRHRGRMSGQVRIRVRYRTYMTPWFDYLLVSKKEMQRLISGTGWCIERFLDSKGPAYIAVIRKRT